MPCDISHHDLRFQRARSADRPAHAWAMQPRFPPRGTNALRRGRVSVEGRWYLLTFCCFERARVFDDAGAAKAAVDVLASASVWRVSHLHAWVLMPDHFHALVRLHAESLSKLVGRVKSVSSAAVRRERLIATPIWMPGFHDRALHDQASVEAAREYILENPARAGLDAGYPYRGSASMLPSL